MTIINLGSQNKTKYTAVHETVRLYPNLFPDPQINTLDVKVEEFGHPKSIKETAASAIKRALMAFDKCNISIGLESGLMEMPYSTTGFMEVNVCAIYDGEKHYLGLSPGFEWPKAVTEKILTKEADASLAFKQLGLTDSEKLGAEKGGIIGKLTHFRMFREDYMKYSIIMALIQLEKKEMY